jgi:hypothetical protein
VSLLSPFLAKLKEEGKRLCADLPTRGGDVRQDRGGRLALTVRDRGHKAAPGIDAPQLGGQRWSRFERGGEATADRLAAQGPQRYLRMRCPIGSLKTLSS